MKNEQVLLRSFKEDGFIVIPGFLNMDEVQMVHLHLDRLIAEKVPKMAPEQVFYEDRNNPATLKQIQRLFDHDPYFYGLMFKSRFEALAALLLQDNVVGKNMQYFNKPPRVGLATPPHQDGYYFMLEPNEAVTMWLGPEKVDEENGCVRYVRGSHLHGMRPHGKTNTLGFSQGISDYGQPEDREYWIATQPGDLLVHHSLTIHRADANNSQIRSRKALGFIYYAQNAKENTQAKEDYQKRLTEEIRKNAVIR